MKVAFLDRDGVLNVDFGYVHNWDNFVWIPGSIEAMQKLQDHGFNIIIITNQAGIARGYYSEKDFHKLMKEMRSHLDKFNVKILDIFFCPHHIEGKTKKYRKNCSCRKPEPGMLLNAIEKYNINRNESIFIGDRESDIIAGRAAGIDQSIKVDSVRADTILSKFNHETQNTLLSAVNRLLKK